jgi:hypothetical protein
MKTLIIDTNMLRRQASLLPDNDELMLGLWEFLHSILDEADKGKSIVELCFVTEEGDAYHEPTESGKEVQ